MNPNEAEFEGKDESIGIHDALALITGCAEREDSEPEEGRQDKREVFGFDLAKIVGGRDRLKEWKKWGFDLEGLAFENPDIVIEYIGTVRANSFDNCRDKYETFLQKLSEAQLGGLDNYLVAYAAQRLSEQQRGDSDPRET